MRYLGYVWAAISFGTPWIGGNGFLQIMAWAIGMIGPLILAIGLLFGINKTVLALSVIAILVATALIVLWIVDLDFWMNAPPPAVCDRDHCDNDGAIRMSFRAGAVLLPVLIPSLFAGPVSFFFAFRRLFRKSSIA